MNLSSNVSPALRHDCRGDCFRKTGKLSIRPSDRSRESPVSSLCSQSSATRKFIRAPLCTGTMNRARDWVVLSDLCRRRVSAQNSPRSPRDAIQILNCAEQAFLKGHPGRPNSLRHCPIHVIEVQLRRSSPHRRHWNLPSWRSFAPRHSCGVDFNLQGSDRTA